MYYKKISTIAILLVSLLGIAYADPSIRVGDLQWNIFPSYNPWEYSDNYGGYGCFYHIIDLSKDDIRNVVGKYEINDNDTTLIYFVQYRCRLLDPTGNNVQVDKDFIQTYIHKIYVKDRFAIPLLDIDSIGNLCGDTGCNDGWIPVPEDSLGIRGFIQDSTATVRDLESLFGDVDISPLCDSMWAGAETYLAAPINPVSNSSDASHINNLYGEYRFVINKWDGGIDELKPIFGVYSPFFYRRWENKWYEYDLEFFPKKLTIYNKQGNNLMRWERPYQYVLTKETNIPDAYIGPTQSIVPGVLRTWIKDTVIATFIVDTLYLDFDIKITDDIVNDNQNSYLYGHYILQPGSIHNDSSYYSIKDFTHVIGINNDGETNVIPYVTTRYIHHSGLGKAFNTTTYPLENISTHFLAWLPGEMKAYGYNGDVQTPDSTPYLFHYVRHNPCFNAEIFNKDSLPWIKVVHSQYYYLVLKIKINKSDDEGNIYISWVDSSDVANGGFNNLASQNGMWREWWQDPHVLLGGEYDSLFADTVSYAFNWKPYIQLHRVGDTLFWNAFKDSAPNGHVTLEYIISRSRNSNPIIPRPIITSDTFIVDSTIDDTTCLYFAIRYTYNNLSYTSDNAVTWYPSVRLDYPDTNKFDRLRRISWPHCPCADFYEIWYREDTSKDWTIDTTQNTYYSIWTGLNTEIIVKVRAIKNQFPMAWGIVGNLKQPSGLSAKISDFRLNKIYVRWEDNSQLENGYILEYKFRNESSWRRELLPENSEEACIILDTLVHDSLQIRIYPIFYSNPIDTAGDIFIGTGNSITILPYFTVKNDTSYIVNSMATSSINNYITFVNADDWVYTMIPDTNILNGKGIESSIDLYEDTIVTVWNDGKTLFLQLSCLSGTILPPFVIYKVNKPDIEYLTGISIAVDAQGMKHISTILTSDKEVFLLHGKIKDQNSIAWDSIPIIFDAIPYKTSIDMYGISTTPSGNFSVINFAINKDFYTFITSSEALNTIKWEGMGAIYNPIFWDTAGKFIFPFVDSSDSLKFISIDTVRNFIDTTQAYYYYPYFSNNVYLTKTLPFKVSLATADIDSSKLHNFLFAYDDTAFMTLQMESEHNCQFPMSHLIGFSTALDLEGKHLIWNTYFLYRSIDSLLHYEHFSDVVSSPEQGGPQGNKTKACFPELLVDKTILNAGKENLDIVILFPSHEDEINVRLYDVTGRAIWERDIRPSTNARHRLSIPLKHFPQGVYFVRATIGNKVFTRKIITLKK